MQTEIYSQILHFSRTECTSSRIGKWMHNWRNMSDFSVIKSKAKIEKYPLLLSQLQSFIQI